MIFKIFFLRKKLKALLNKATTAIYSERFDFSELVKHLCEKRNNYSLLKAYVVIHIITEKCIPIDKTETKKAIKLYLESENMLLNSTDPELVLSLYKAKAEKGFFESKVDFTIGELAFKSNEYSYEGLKYKIEKIKKGPLTLEEHEKFKNLSKQIFEAENNLKDQTNKSLSDKSLEEALNKIKLAIEDDIKKNGNKTDEELDRDYQDLINEFKKTIK